MYIYRVFRMQESIYTILYKSPLTSDERTINPVYMNFQLAYQYQKYTENRVTL